MFTLCKRHGSEINSSLRILGIVFSVLFFSSAQAQQTVSPTEPTRWKARITEIKTTPTAPAAIPVLKWTPQEIWVDSQGPVQYARIKWAIEGEYQTVSINGRAIKPKADGTFDVNFGFTNNEKAFRVSVVTQAGKNYQGSFKIAQIGEAQVATAPAKRLRFTAGLGGTLINYKQRTAGGTQVADFSQYAVTVKGGSSFRVIPDKLDASVSAFMNVAALSAKSNDATITEKYDIRYLGVNLRAGYHVIRAPSQFRLIMNAGFYYNTSYGNIGFSNMYGPQVYPELSYIFNNGHAALLYAKFSPALFNGTIDFKSNKEAAMGAYYVFPMNPKLRMAVGFDISKLDLATVDQRASTTTYSLSTGVSF